ncbi:MAG: AraC family transcriptional regulator [Lachnospiraceae bacterium]|nr:AraC family transcriptional regulator [Lachnospiraceae bacterium]
MLPEICEIRTDPEGRELTKHGTALFPAACYHDDLSKQEVLWHWHDELEAVVVSEGAAVVSAETKKYVIRKGGGFFVNAGVLHACRDLDGFGCRFHGVVFHPRLIGSLDSIFWHRYMRPVLENSLLKSLCLDGREFWHEEAIKAVEKAWQAGAGEEPGYEFQMREALSRLVLILSGCQTKETETPSPKTLRDMGRMKIMLQYIQENYAKELTAAGIAASAAISESECLRCFGAAIGTSPGRYVRQLRLQKAAELLAGTGERIADIGAQCGFSDTSYFTKAFRAWRGMTPSEYRKMEAASRNRKTE